MEGGCSKRDFVLAKASSCTEDVGGGLLPLESIVRPMKWARVLKIDSSFSFVVVVVHVTGQVFKVFPVLLLLFLACCASQNSNPPARE